MMNSGFEENLFRCLHFPENTVDSRLLLLTEEGRQLDGNVPGFHGTVDTEPSGTYDYILADARTRGPLSSYGELSRLPEVFSGMLKEDGNLVLTVSNRFSFNVLAGFDPEPDQTPASISDVRALACSALYLPWPSEREWSFLLSEAEVRKLQTGTDQGQEFPPALRTLAETGELFTAAPAFVLLFRKKNGAYLPAASFPAESGLRTGKLSVDAAGDSAAGLDPSELTRAGLQQHQETIEELKKELSTVREEIYAQDITLRKEREEQRLTRNHASNLEKINSTHERDIQSLQASVRYYAAHQSRLRLFLRKMHAHLMHSGKDPLFEAYGRLLFQRPENALVSIVVYCRNELTETYRLLTEILHFTDFEKTPYEVILADDLSDDGTRSMEQYAENVYHVRSREQEGFARSVNEAAAAAHGRFLVVLENRVDLTDGWLSGLVTLLSERQDIGMAGPKLLRDDASLLAAGGVIFRDGSYTMYGEGMDQDLPEVNYVKPVDFLPAPAFLIRTELWKKIGGFSLTDASAAADLAFSVRKAGYEVYYDPESVVSYDRPLSDAVTEKFRKRWQSEISRQAVKGDLFRARERAGNALMILMADDKVPSFDQDAGSRHDYQHIRFLLSHGARIKFLPDDYVKSEPYTHILEHEGVEVLYGNAARAGIFDYIDRNRHEFDLAYLNRPHVAVKYLDFIRQHTDWRVIFFGHDVYSLRISREYELTKDEKLKDEIIYWRNLEFSVMRKSDVTYVVSEYELSYIHGIDPAIPLKPINIYIYDQDAEIQPDPAPKKNLLFVGGFGHPPNKDGLFWFVRGILPLVRKSLPDVVLRVAGSGADDEVRALDSRKDVEILGYVTDEQLHELYQTSRLVVVPLRYGAGVKGKVVQALHEGAPLITTSCGAEGIPEPESVMVIRDTPEEFASEIIRLYKDPVSLRRMTEAGVRYIRQYFSAEKCWEQIREDFEAVRRK